MPPEKEAEIKDLAQSIREAIAAEIGELATHRASTDDAHRFGPNEFPIRAIAHPIAAKAVAQHLAGKNRLPRRRGNLAAPRPGGRVPFPPRSHLPQPRGARPRPPRLRPVPGLRRGPLPVRPRRRPDGPGPDAGPGAGRHPGRATLAGAVADSFEKGAEWLAERAGARVSEATVERTTADAGRRRADAVAAGATVGPKADWAWHKDYDGERGADVELDATGVRQQAARGGPAEGRRASVGGVRNPCPEWPWPDEKPGPIRARSRSGLDPLEDFAPWLRAAAGHGGRDRADRGIGLSDGGKGWEGRLGANFPRGELVILAFVHPAAKLTALARRLDPKDEDPAEKPARPGRGLPKDEGGATLAAVLSAWAWPRRPGPREAVDDRVGDLERTAHRMEDPEDLAQGWCLGSKAVESACQTVVGPRLKRAGMRWGKDGAHAACHLRALDRGEQGQGDACRARDYSPN